MTAIMSSASKRKTATENRCHDRKPASGKRDQSLIVIVGVCGSGKSLLAGKLSAAGFNARPVAQEHSLIASLFRRSKPNAVIFLEASDATVASRKSSGWEPTLLREQRERLELARRQADIVLNTDDTDPEQLAAEAFRCLNGLF